MEIELKKVVLYKGNYSDYKKNKQIRLDQHRSSYKNQQKQIKDAKIAHDKVVEDAVGHLKSCTEGSVKRLEEEEKMH